MSVDKLRVFHEELLQEEGLKVSELPTEIQHKIRGFNLMRNKLVKNPDDEKLFLNLQKQATKLGDEVQNFIENDYDDDDDDDDDSDDDNDDNDDNDDDDDTTKRNQNSSSKKPQKNTSSSKDDNKPSKSDSSEGDKTAKPKATTGGRFGNSMMEKKIISIMDSRGDKRIRITDLEAIIGKEPEYPEQQVNNIKLRKVFLSSDYRLV
jgi:hypothetical protein